MSKAKWESVPEGLRKVIDDAEIIAEDFKIVLKMDGRKVAEFMPRIGFDMKVPQRVAKECAAPQSVALNATDRLVDSKDDPVHRPYRIEDLADAIAADFANNYLIGVPVAELSDALAESFKDLAGGNLQAGVLD